MISKYENSKNKHQISTVSNWCCTEMLPLLMWILLTGIGTNITTKDPNNNYLDSA